MTDPAQRAVSEKIYQAGPVNYSIGGFRRGSEVNTNLPNFGIKSIMIYLTRMIITKSSDIAPYRKPASHQKSFPQL